MDNDKVNEFCDLLKAALTAEYSDGYATGRYVHDHTSNVADLRASLNVAHHEQSESRVAMWRAFYDMMGSTNAGD